MVQTARDAAVAALVQWERERTYSNIVLDNLLRSEALSPADAALTTRLVYGVIERLLTLDWVLGKTTRRPLRSCHAFVRAILRVGAYQLLFMEKIPAAAAVNEAVEQTKRVKQAHAAGFVNGVLRAVEREGKRLMQSLTTDLKGQSVRHSVPLELLTAWKKAYGLETAVSLAASANEAPPAVIRVNTLKTTVSQFRSLLSDTGILFETITGLPAALIIADAASLRASAIASELYYFQDAASQWACAALDAKAGERIADVCAAPGGKSFTCAMDMKNTGEIRSFDIYDEKIATIQKRAASYGIACLTAEKRDAAKPCEAPYENCFDRVLCDAPCSGLGVIRRKPEIRYKSLTEFGDLAELQYTILCESARMVKNGGVLQYSTCTLRPEENERIAERFLREHAEFSPRTLPITPLFEVANQPPTYCITLMPHTHRTDGFFIASFVKEGCL